MGLSRQESVITASISPEPIWFANMVAALINSGELRSAATQDLGTINATNLRTAHQQLESGRVIGKLTLTGF